MDKSWMQCQRWSLDYLVGVDNFLKFAFERGSVGNKILCPCKKCANRSWKVHEIMREHLICDGFVKGYNHWYHQGERLPSLESSRSSSRVLPEFSPHNQHDPNMQAEIEGLLRDAFNMHQQFDDSSTQASGLNGPSAQDRGKSGIDVGYEQPTGEAAKFYKLLEDMNEPLYEGSKYSKLSFAIRFFHLKCISGMTGKAFDSLCEFLRDVFPSAAIPSSSRDAKKLIKDLGFGYEKIYCCPNDCILYWDDRADLKYCPECGTSRYLNSYGGLNDDDECEVQVRNKPSKVLRYFSLIPRLQRLFMSSKTSDSMRWHDERRTKDGRLRHPANALAWKAFDSRYPNFASDSRNVRLGLASDSFNPFKMMSTFYSTWPVVLIPYNLPPWIGMKQPSFFSSMIIPGEKGPGNDIDIFLQPLIKELQQLWEGVETCDVSRKQNFRLRAALLWTINDFPAYANLSRWSTKGKYACPCCAGGTTTSYASARDMNPLEGNVDYYGVLNDIIELDYYNNFKVMLFRCDWADVNSRRGIKTDKLGFTLVNFNRLIHTGEQLVDEPYVFSSQVKQVFYSKDPNDEDWFVVLCNTPRDLFDMGNGSIEDVEPRTECFPLISQPPMDDVNWVREDVEEDIYET